MVGTIICEVGTIMCDIDTINVRFYLLEIPYPRGYCRITRGEIHLSNLFFFLILNLCKKKFKYSSLDYT